MRTDIKAMLSALLNLGVVVELAEEDPSELSVSRPDGTPLNPKHIEAVKTHKTAILRYLNRRPPGRPASGRKVWSVRVTDAEFAAIKTYLAELRSGGG